jgi:hypothetical protein
MMEMVFTLYKTIKVSDYLKVEGIVCTFLNRIPKSRLFTIILT